MITPASRTEAYKAVIIVSGFPHWPTPIPWTAPELLLAATSAVAFVAANLSAVKHTILVLSGKGGVGKSTFSAQLAFTLAAHGRSVGLLDIDICGPSIPRMLGMVDQKVHQSASGWSPVWVGDNLGVMSIGFMLPDQDGEAAALVLTRAGLIESLSLCEGLGAFPFPSSNDGDAGSHSRLPTYNISRGLVITPRPRRHHLEGPP